MNTCPECKSKVVWRFFNPKVAHQYCCKVCGHTWNDSMNINSTGGHYGTFLGKWTAQEMAKLEKELVPVYQEHSRAAVDWSFFKGKKILTAWRKADSDKLINVTKFDELLYWIAYAVQHEKTWYADYQKNLS